MANPKTRTNLNWEASAAQVALAGIRPLFVALLQPAASAAATHTVAATRQATRRVIVFHDSGVNTDIRIAVNATAVATDFPVASGVYFVLEVAPEDTVSVFNTSAGPLDVHILEIA